MDNPTTALLFVVDLLNFQTLHVKKLATLLDLPEKKELNKLFNYRKRKTAAKIEIKGQTDNVGNDEDNRKLSQQRADAVKNYLKQKGIAANRMKTQGFGSLQPIADNSTESGRQKNRRTVLKIM